MDADGVSVTLVTFRPAPPPLPPLARGGGEAVGRQEPPRGAPPSTACYSPRVNAVRRKRPSRVLLADPVPSRRVSPPAQRPGQWVARPACRAWRMAAAASQRRSPIIWMASSYSRRDSSSSDTRLSCNRLTHGPGGAAWPAGTRRGVTGSKSRRRAGSYRALHHPVLPRGGRGLWAYPEPALPTAQASILHRRAGLLKVREHHPAAAGAAQHRRRRSHRSSLSARAATTPGEASVRGRLRLH